MTKIIKPCRSYEWKASDVCLKKDSCFYKPSETFFKPFYIVYNLERCKCANNHSVLCQNRKYCGLNQEACKHLNINQPIKHCCKYLISFLLV